MNEYRLTDLINIFFVLFFSSLVNRNIAIKYYCDGNRENKSFYSTEQNDLALVPKAFAHPARVAIIQYLVKANACINGELVQELGLAQATISQHLRELKQVGIIQGTIEGVSISYLINSRRWSEIKGLFNVLFDQYNDPEKGMCG